MRAKEILRQIDKGEAATYEVADIPAKQTEDIQIGFADLQNNRLKEILSKIDVTTLTPIEALNQLYELVKIANE